MLIPSLILMYLIITKQNGLSKYFTKETLEKLSVSNQYFSNKARNITLFLSLIFMIIALARPVTNEKMHNSKQELNAIIIALDVSKSMKAVDIYPNRLEFAKRKLLDIIELSKTNALGVILFAKSSFILSPLTQDFVSLKTLVENIDTGMNFDNGTNIYSTLEATNKLLKDYSNKNLIILSDGADSENFDEEIDFANENNINIYTLGLATKLGAAIKLQDGNYLTNKDGKIVNVKLNDKIKELSLKTNGGYMQFTLNNNDISQILNDINKKSTKQQFEEKKFKTYTELFYYPLVIAILLLLIAFSSLPSFSKNKTVSSFFLFLLIASNFNYVNASILDFQTIRKAKEAYEKNDYDSAVNDYKEIPPSQQRDYNLANSLYKKGNFKEAIDLYKNIETEDSNLNFQRLHNLGNSYVKNKDLQNAKKSYEEALKIKNDPQTKENLDLVNKALKNKENQENKDNQDKQNNKDEQQKKDKKDKNQKNDKQNNDKQKENKADDNKKSQKNKDKEQENKKEQNQNNKSKENNEKKKEAQIDKSQISDLEEKKWLKQIENQKSTSMLKKMESSKEDSSSNPW
jgi:Ca-activated chloride channel homolog